MKRYTVALAVLLACSYVLGAEETTTVEVKDGTVVVKNSTGEVSAKTGETVVTDGKQVVVVKDPNAPEEQWKLEIQKKLQRKVSFELVDTPLQEAIQFLSTLFKVPMIIDPKVLEANPAAITLRGNDMSMDLALGRILRLADLDYVLKDKAIFISKKVAQAAVGSASVTVDGKTFEVEGDSVSVSASNQNGMITIQCGKLTLTGNTSTLKSGDKTYDISKSETVKITIKASGDKTYDISKSETVKITIKAGKVEVNGNGDGKQQDQKKDAEF